MNRNKARKLPCAVIAVDDTRKALGRLAARYRSDYEAVVVAVGGSNGMVRPSVGQAGWLARPPRLRYPS